MADPRQIERGTRRRNVDRRVTWRERLTTTDDRGESTHTFVDHPI